MKTNFSQKKRRLLGGYTLIETLIATGILMYGVGAAASMSLSMITVEEINERTVRALNYLENAADLYRLGVDTDDIQGLLPADPVITNLAFASRSQTVASIGTVDTMEITITFKPAKTNQTWTSDTWTGGDSSVTRTQSVEVLRSSQYVAP